MATESQDYVLGRGKLYFDRFLPGTKTPTGKERYFGNTTELNFSLSSDKLDHFSSESGVKVKDDSVTLQTDSTGNFICDNINADNLALFFLGESETVTVAGGVGVAETFADIELGLYYQLGVSAANPAGTKKVATVTCVKDPTGAATAVLAANNFEVDLELGRIYLLPAAVDIADGDDLEFTYDQTAHTRERVISKSESIAGALRFVADNPKGSNRDYYIPYAEISPDGDFALKGDDWQQIGFTLEILKRDDDTERLYIEGRAVV